MKHKKYAVCESLTFFINITILYKITTKHVYDENPEKISPTIDVKGSNANKKAIRNKTKQNNNN